jgi:hypothetical protein
VQERIERSKHLLSELQVENEMVRIELEQQREDAREHATRHAWVRPAPQGPGAAP